MEAIQKKRILWRIPLIVALVYAVYWGVRFLISHQIPSWTQIAVTNPSIPLPFPISRLWDIPISALYAIIFIIFFTSKKINKIIDKDEIYSFLVILPIAWLITSAIISFWTGLAAALFFAIVLSLIVDLIIVLIKLLYELLAFLFAFKFWSKIGKWLAGLE